MASLTSAFFERRLAGAARPRPAAGLPAPPPVGIVDRKVTSAEEAETASVGWEARYAQLGTGGCRGRRLALRAQAFLRRNLAEPPTIAALSRAMEASERTLHDAFRKHLETTPKAYLKTLRLNAARQSLLEGREGRRVTDVALDWGFLHFGWFSQDYRRLFGETPSRTLQRGRAEGRPHAWS